MKKKKKKESRKLLLSKHILNDMLYKYIPQISDLKLEILSSLRGSAIHINFCSNFRRSTSHINEYMVIEKFVFTTSRSI